MYSTICRSGVRYLTSAPLTALRATVSSSNWSMCAKKSLSSETVSQGGWNRVVHKHGSSLDSRPQRLGMELSHGLELRLDYTLLPSGRIAAKEPFQVSLKPGKWYFWCRCGRSKNQPWCDGSHKGTDFSPIKFEVAEEEPEAFLCGCKQTGSRPYCDGTHATPSVQNA